MISSFAAAIIAAIFGVCAAISAQRAFAESRRANPLSYFGGAPIVPEFPDENSVRADGARERASLRVNLLQTTTTSFLVATALISLHASLGSVVSQMIAALGAVIGIVQPLIAVCQWWPSDRRTLASTEYFVLMQRGGKMLSVDEQRVEFAKRFPRMVRWIAHDTRG